jgi:hypothetical protein
MRAFLEGYEIHGWMDYNEIYYFLENEWSLSSRGVWLNAIEG